MRDTGMKTTTLAVLLTTLALAVTAGAETEAKPSALGVSEGDPVPANSRRNDDAGQVLRIGVLPGVAGLDRVLVAYTERQGACKVVGVVDVDNARADSYGTAHKQAVDDLVNRVKGKLGADPTTTRDFNVDTLFHRPQDWVDALRRDNATYSSIWEDDAARPFRTVYVHAEYGYVQVHFEFKNFVDCHAEQEAADAAVF